MKHFFRGINILTLLLGLSCVAMGQYSSLLNSGHWWKVSVNEEGVYSLTTRDIPALQDVAIDSLGVYGANGAMLSTRNNETPTNILKPIPIDIIDHNNNGLFDSDDELLFFGEGSDRWVYDNTMGRWIFATHAYANENCYYLTTNSPEHVRIATAPEVETDTTLTTHTMVAHHENNLVNLLGSGQTWLGEKLSSVQTQRNFEVRLAGTGITDVTLHYAVASTSTSQATFTLSTNGFNRQETTSSSNPWREVNDLLSTSSQSYTFTLTFNPVDNAGFGYLDYIELTAHASLTYGGGQTIVRNDQHLGNAVRFQMSGLGESRVWEVTTAGAEREMAVSNNSWTDNTSMARRYVVFDGYSYLTPSSIKKIEPQDLHACAEADLVVVTHKDFLEQATRLAGLHELFDGMSVLVVTDEQVYNEYSSGKQDPMAIRSFLRDMKSRHEAHPPLYLQLFGKGTYDNRNYLGGTLPTIVTYETPWSFDSEGSSFASDDMLGYLSPSGRGTSSETLEVSVGRLPAKDTAEAKLLVNKIEHYITRRDLTDEECRGDWRNYVALLADDADPGKGGDTIFAHSSEAIATTLKTTIPQINIDRLYADAYHQESGAIGSYYPDLNNALRQRMNYGCLLLNYIGHGSTAYIGTERYIEPTDITAYNNGDRLPLFVTSTCSYSRYDVLDELCGAEACVLAPAAMIAVIGASRPISHIERFNKDVVLFALDPQNTIGDALRKAKNRTPVSMCIGLMGDPALRLSQPENRVKVTHINMEPVSDTADVTANVLSRVTVQGEVQDKDGNLIEDFDGTLYPIVFDREMRSTTLANDNPYTQISFWQQKTVLYKGSHAVTGGRFEYTFLVPRDVPYQYAYAKLSHYAKSGSDHATGSFLRLKLGGMSDVEIEGMKAPEITLFIGDTNFRAGGLTGTSPTLLAHIFDSVGINVGTGLGHDITAVIDDNPNSLIVLNDLYQQDIGDSRRGSVAYTLQKLTPGRHKVTVKAWNIYGLSGSATIPFTVYGEDELAFSELSCLPNPATTQARFELRVNSPKSITTAELQIYNPRGQIVNTFTPAISAAGYTVGPVLWDVSNVPPGLYLARMVIIDSDGETHQVITKCIVR